MDLDYTLDPSATMRIRKLYEEELGYTNYLEFCRKSKPKTPIELENGYSKLTMLEEKDCLEIIDLIDKDDTILLDQDFRIEVLEKILREGVDDRIAGYFESNFAPIWCRFQKASPDQDIWPPSFKWHCDGGPIKHLKILLYLSSSEESGGNTIFLSKEETDEFRRIGYVFTELDKRLEDLSYLAEVFSVGYNPFMFDINRGEGLLFEPFNLLHKGIKPTLKNRYIMQICFIAAATDWKDICMNTDSPVQENIWPEVRIK